MSRRKRKVPYTPPRAYEVEWTGEGYVARCLCCLMECEAAGHTPSKAMDEVTRHGGCTIRHREMSLEARMGDA